MMKCGSPLVSKTEIPLTVLRSFGDREMPVNQTTTVQDKDVGTDSWGTCSEGESGLIVIRHGPESPARGGSLR
jgi:hypothetical protein